MDSFEGFTVSSSNEEFIHARSCKRAFAKKMAANLGFAAPMPDYQPREDGISRLKGRYTTTEKVDDLSLWKEGIDLNLSFIPHPRSKGVDPGSSHNYLSIQMFI